MRSCSRLKKKKHCFSIGNNYKLFFEYFLVGFRSLKNVYSLHINNKFINVVELPSTEYFFEGTRTKLSNEILIFGH